MSKKTDGSINIRVSRKTHKRLKEHAEKRGQSFDRIIGDALSAVAFIALDGKLVTSNGLSYTLTNTKK